MFHISRAQADAGDGIATAVFSGLVHTGDQVNVRGPYGRFVLDQHSPRALAFLCCDTGFAPVQGLIEHALAIDAAPALALVWAATRPGGQYRSGQCRAWSESLDNFRYLPFAAVDATAAGTQAAAAVAADLPAPDGWDFYVCGPDVFIAEAVRGLVAAGVPVERIVSEAA